MMRTQTGTATGNCFRNDGLEWRTAWHAAVELVNASCATQAAGMDFGKPEFTNIII